MDLIENQISLYDERSKCLSVSAVTTTSSYLAFAFRAYENRGGVEGQRSPLKTKTAITIRSRMVDDLLQGAVLPPIVIGIVVTKDEMDELQQASYDRNLQKISDILANIPEDSIAIIDGMQRTTALFDAALRNVDAMKGKPVRLELWATESANNLIYRMLVLNTGQVPWDVRRQLQTVYSFLLREIRVRVPDLSLFEVDDARRRTQGGEFHASSIIESYMVFTSRKAHVNIKERVSEDFARIDVTESASDITNLSRFIDIIKIMCDIDYHFSRYKSKSDESQRFLNGKDIFSSSPAILGFVCAFAVSIYGAPGFNYDYEEVTRKSDGVFSSILALTQRISAMSESEIGEFLQLEVLSELTNVKSGKVGEFEREFFFKAFSTMIKHATELHDMLPCWRAY